jgi:hypothetical protein
MCNQIPKTVVHWNACCNILLVPLILNEYACVNDDDNDEHHHHHHHGGGGGDCVDSNALLLLY